MRARGADGQSSAVAWVNLLSIYALAELPAARHVLGFEGGRAFARRNACAPRCGRPASAWSTSFPARSTTNGTSSLPPPKLAPAALASAVVAGAARRRRGRLSGRRRAGMARALARQSQGAGTRAVRPMKRASPSWPRALAAGSRSRVDRPDADAVAANSRRSSLPPEFGQCAGRSASRRSRATTSADRPGTGTIFPAASTPARISTRRSTGSPAATCRTTATDTIPPERFVGARLRHRLQQGGRARRRFPADRGPSSSRGRRSTAASRRAPGC